MASEALAAQTQTSLYRRWRPQDFSDVVGQHYTVQTLRNALARGEFAHAYLFAGSRGTGKTSVARILAKAVNCEADDLRETGEPCNACASCERILRGNALDVIEIDGASNRGIDQIRQLREEVTYAPTQSRYKVYIIDEVHMLTHEAFNALLKTLEEPPSHVVFVFATTEPHKVPSTVLSRCQAFEFPNIPPKGIVDQLRAISEAEGIPIEEAALEALARHAQGALRNALVLLEQLVAYTGGDRITETHLSDVLGIPPDETLDAFLEALRRGEGATAVEMVGDLADRGRDLELFWDELIQRGRDRLLAQLEAEDADDGVWLALLDDLLEVQRTMRFAADRRMLLEVRALTLARRHGPPDGLDASTVAEPTASAPAASGPSSGPSSEPTDQTGAPPTPEATSRDASDVSAGSDDPHKPSPREAASGGAPTVQELWSALLERAKADKIGVYALLAEGNPRMADHELVIAFPPTYAFHKQRLEQPDHLDFVRDLVRSISGEELEVRVRFLENEETAPEPADSANPDATEAPSVPDAASASAASSSGSPGSPMEALDATAEQVRAIFDGEILD